jgi:protein CpxP
MKRTLKRLAALTAMGFTLGTSVYAQPFEDGHAWAGERMEHHRAQMAKFHEKRLAALKAKLKLTPNQESAWNNFEQAHQPPRDTLWQRPDREALAKLKTPERLDEMQKQFDTHHSAMQSHMRQMEGATRQFYAVLTPEQQKVFDAETLPPTGGPHGRESKDRP